MLTHMQNKNFAHPCFNYPQFCLRMPSLILDKTSNNMNFTACQNLAGRIFCHFVVLR